MATTQLTILQKNGLFSFLGLIKAQQLNLDELKDFQESNARPMMAVVKLDPREGQPLLKQFETTREALSKYEDAISTSLERGWAIVYRGIPLRG
ncbi:MAG TPA: hypothetical protein VFZ34_00335 [Blastocatellia bacterium]|nr:hypothetical protein [Blastocatellia bacterium]